jgi:hypothetical protein
MKISKDIKLKDLAIELQNNLIIADVHIGYEEALNKQGIFMPKFHFNDVMKRLKSIIKRKKYDKIIINGDLKHEFGAISNEEWRNTLKFLDYCSEHSKEIIIIKGNHDKIIGPIAKKRNVKIVDSLIIEDVMIIHGDIIVDTPKLIKTIIIGHEHPAIGIRDRMRVETYKCYLIGKYKTKNLIVQPSFNIISEGTDVIKEDLLSPYLKQRLNKFNVIVVADEKNKSQLMNFGTIKDVKLLS